MIEQNDFENSNVLASTENKKRFTLRFSEDTIRRIRVFCESFFIELNEFIANTIRYYLYTIGEDIESNEFDLIGRYYDISKLVGMQPLDIPHEISEKKSTINTEIPPLISKAVEDLCNEIPSTPEEFIEDIVKWSIDDIINKIKKDEYDFLDKYKDLSIVQKSIQQIYEKKLL